MISNEPVKKRISSIIIIFPLIMLIAAMLIGRYPISIAHIVEQILENSMDVQNSIIWYIRFPRAIVGFLIGGSLAISGATLQGLFRNPLVDTGMLGVNSGAGFGAVIAILLFDQNTILTLLFAFTFGMIAVGLAFIIWNFYKQSSTIMLVLGGVIVSSLFSSLISFGKYIADPFDQLPSIVFWLMGSVANTGYRELLYLTVPILLGTTVILILRRKINILSMGDKEALSLGINTKKVKMLLIISCSLLTAASVSVAGTIGWVGLIIPHIIRMLIGNDHNRLIPLSFLLGGSFLMFIDIIARSITTAEMPIGILTSLIGAPFYILLLKRTKGGNW